MSDFLDSLLDDFEADASGGRKGEALFNYPNVNFRLKITGTDVFKPQKSGDGKNRTGIVYYKYEGEILEVTPREGGKGVGACTDEQLARAQKLVGRTGTMMVQFQNRRIAALDAAGNPLKADQIQNAANFRVEPLDEDADETNNKRSNLALFKFAYAAARQLHGKSPDGQYVIPDVASAKVPVEVKRETAKLLVDMQKAAFEGRDQAVFGGAEVIIATEAYEKKDKDKKLTGEVGTASHCLPVPEVVEG